MKTRVWLIGSIAAAALLLSVALERGALGQRSGGGSAGAHGGGGGAHVGGGGVPGHTGPRPGGGFGHGSPGWRGYGGRGYGWGPYYAWGWGLGVYLATLPWYYTTFYWDGVPYYYGDGGYFVWNSTIGEYEQIEPSPELIEQATAKPAGSMDLFAYPKNGQSAALQAQDKADCQRWAAGTTGFDPSKPSAASPQNYLRAEAACLEGRGYSVE